MKKLTIKTTHKNNPAVTITRNAVRLEKLVYIACANKPFKYHNGGKSRIVYIGTTKSGADRIAQSAAKKAKELLIGFGVTRLDFFTISCGKRKKVQTWRKLERGLILSFKSLFGEPPKANKHGRKMSQTNELNYFTRDRLESIVKMYS